MDNEANTAIQWVFHYGESLAFFQISQLQGESDLHSEMISFYEQLHKARKDAYILLSDCLCMETKSACARYCDLWKGEPLRLAHVCIEPIPAFLLNDGNNRPEIVDTESMCRDKKMQLGEICYPESVPPLYDFLKSIYLRRAVRFKV